MGRNKYNNEEKAFAFYLYQFPRGPTYRFGIDYFTIPEDFPDTETYKWETVDVSWIPKILTYQGYNYKAEDIEQLKEKFDI